MKIIIEDLTFAWWDEYDEKRWIDIAYIDDDNNIVIEFGENKIVFEDIYELAGFISGLETIKEKIKENDTN